MNACNQTLMLVISELAWFLQRGSPIVVLVILKLYSSLTYCAVVRAADIAFFLFFELQLFMIDCYCLFEVLYRIFCLRLNIYDIQLQSRRIRSGEN